MIKTQEMASLRLFFKFMDVLFISVWGLTIMDLLKISNVTAYSSIDNWIKTLMAVLGLIYLVISIPHKIKMQRLDREKKQEEIEKLKIENEKLNDK